MDRCSVLHVFATSAVVRDTLSLQRMLSSIAVEEWKTSLMSLANFFTSYVLNMFRTLIYPSSGDLRLCWWITISFVLFSVRNTLKLYTTNWEQDDRCGNSSTQSQAPDDGYINVRNMLSTYLITYSMVQSPSWEANWFAASQEISPHFMEPEDSLPHSQASATCSYPMPAQSSPHTYILPPGDPS